MILRPPHLPSGVHLRYRPLPSRAVFLARVVAGIGRAAVLLGGGLGLGMLGYHYIVGLDWIDSLLNAAMLLGGEGPLSPTPTTAGKLFAAFYALFGGIVFVTVAGLVLAPALHRLLHRFHLELGVEDALPRPPAPERTER